MKGSLIGRRCYVVIQEGIMVRCSGSEDLPDNIFGGDQLNDDLKNNLGCWKIDKSHVVKRLVTDPWVSAGDFDPDAPKPVPAQAYTDPPEWTCKALFEAGWVCQTKTNRWTLQGGEVYCNGEISPGTIKKAWVNNLRRSDSVFKWVAPPGNPSSTEGWTLRKLFDAGYRLWDVEGDQAYKNVATGEYLYYRQTVRKSMILLTSFGWENELAADDLITTVDADWSISGPGIDGKESLNDWLNDWLNARIDVLAYMGASSDAECTKINLLSDDVLNANKSSKSEVAKEKKTIQDFYEEIQLEHSGIPTSTKENTMKDQLVNYTKSLAVKLKPYQNSLLAFAALLAIDYFFFGGKGSAKIQSIASKLYTKMERVVDKGVSKLCGEKEE